MVSEPYLHSADDGPIARNQSAIWLKCSKPSRWCQSLLFRNPFFIFHHHYYNHSRSTSMCCLAQSSQQACWNSGQWITEMTDYLREKATLDSMQFEVSSMQQLSRRAKGHSTVLLKNKIPFQGKTINQYIWISPGLACLSPPHWYRCMNPTHQPYSTWSIWPCYITTACKPR